MDEFEAFWTSPENQKKYGFTYEVTPKGFCKIVYDGYIDDLLQKAYDAVDCKEMEIIGDSYPILELELKKSGEVVIKGTDQPVTLTVDGVGDEPNFALDFTYNDTRMLIRFSLVQPEFYPADFDCPFYIPMSSLSVLNEIMRSRYTELIGQWNDMRFMDMPAVPGFYPNYRAINRIK